MNSASCSRNLTECLSSMGLKQCEANKDICLEHGLCITPIIPSPVSVCICYPCYYGDTCEEEVFSRNLWIAGQTAQTPQMLTAYKFFLVFFSIIQLLNCLLCLQVYFFSRKIRITNVGVYLIFNSIILFLMSIEELVTSVLLYFVDRLPLRYFEIQCLIDQKFLLISLTSIADWSIVLIGVERMLVECLQYNQYDSRKRSISMSLLVFIICPLTTIPGIFTLKNIPANKLNPLTNALLIPYSCINYTPTGYIIFKVISSIHGYGTMLCYILLCVIVFTHLVRHRRRIAPNYTILQNVYVVLRNHRDFFIPLVIPILFSIPMIVINEMMTCAKASKLESLPYLLLVFACIFGLSTKAFTFLYYILPSNVYMIAFWNESPVGRLLQKIKEQMKKIKQRFC